jgi:hypothetical protein
MIAKSGLSFTDIVGKGQFGPPSFSIAGRVKTPVVESQWAQGECNRDSDKKKIETGHRARGEQAKWYFSGAMSRNSSSWTTVVIHRNPVEERRCSDANKI